MSKCACVLPSYITAPHREQPRRASPTEPSWCGGRRKARGDKHDLFLTTMSPVSPARRHTQKNHHFSNFSLFFFFSTIHECCLCISLPPPPPVFVSGDLR